MGWESGEEWDESFPPLAFFALFPSFFMAASQTRRGRRPYAGWSCQGCEAVCAEDLSASIFALWTQANKKRGRFPVRAGIDAPGLFGFGRGYFLSRHFLVAVFHRGLPREPHPALFVHPEAFDRNVVADLDDVLGFLDAEIGQFADVNQAVLAGQKFDERAEFLDRDDLAAIDFSDFGFRRHAGDGVERDLHAFRRDGENVHRAVVFNVNFTAGFLDEAFDVLAARSDERADFCGVDLDRLNARRVFADFLARFGECLGHFGENMHARDAGLFNRLNHHAMRNALELEVELETGDALFRPGNFAIHVAVIIFPADDVGEELVFGDFLVRVEFGADADADAGHRTDHRDARIHQCQRAAANARHRGRAVGLHDLAGDADGVGIILGRNHRFDAALGERAVADFAPAGTADASGFAHGEIREVIVQDEFFLGSAAGVGIKFLRVVAGAERGQRERLGFAAAEQRRTVGARQNADFA